MRMDDLALVEVALQTDGVGHLDLSVESPDTLLRGTTGDLWRMLATRVSVELAPGPPPAGDARWLRLCEALTGAETSRQIGSSTSEGSRMRCTHLPMR